MNQDQQFTGENEDTGCCVREVPLEEFPGIRIGQTEDEVGGTGLTVILCEDPGGMPAGIRIGGGGPAARETGILDPVAAAERIHAAVLGGGSAYGLDAAGGVMRYLEERGIGVRVRNVCVPLVTQIDLFDLPVGSPLARPDREMGYRACTLSEQGKNGNFAPGCRGAGCGATIGKYAGIEHAMKSGIGSCVLRHRDLMVGAIIAVNAYGDIYDWKTGQKIAGARTSDGRFFGREEMISYLFDPAKADTGSAKTQQIKEIDRFGSEAESGGGAFNTTIGVVFTNAPFGKSALSKIASMAHDGLARSVSPVHTSADGDSIIALSVSSVSSGVLPSCVDTAGTLAAWAASEAILRGVKSACSAYGFPSLQDL